MADLALAIAHHLLVFSLAGILAFEIGVVRPSMGSEDVVRIARADRWYGALAVTTLLVGFTRAVFVAKGWAYYSANVLFWMKIAAFAVVSVLSIGPTLVFARWRRASADNPAFSPTLPKIRNVRRFLCAEAIVFAFIPVFAAAMARGYGLLTP
jgi:putative membrane protein